MKKLYIITALLLFFSNTAFAEESHYQLKVDGLVCPFCEYNIEKKVGSLEGISDVKANLENGTVSLILAEGTTLPEANIRKAITDAGFTLKSIDQQK
jgi:mercuric ion binding protein